MHPEREAEPRTDVQLVRLPAELTAEQFPDFQRSLTKRLDAPKARIVLDLSQVVGIGDNAWLGFLVRSLKAARSRGGDLRLAAPAPHVQQLLGWSGLVDVFDVYPTAERAVASFDA